MTLPGEEKYDDEDEPSVPLDEVRGWIVKAVHDMLTNDEYVQGMAELFQLERLREYFRSDEMQGLIAGYLKSLLYSAEMVDLFVDRLDASFRNASQTILERIEALEEKLK